METKIEIGKTALMMRIKRRLDNEAKRLIAARGDRMVKSVGRYYLIDVESEKIVETKIEPEAFARREGILKPYEVVSD
jgi:hypothetical protein